MGESCIDERFGQSIDDAQSQEKGGAFSQHRLLSNDFAIFTDKR
jgi:hypothetical protein